MNNAKKIITESMETKRSDFQAYKSKRIKNNPEVFKDYEQDFEHFKIGAMLKHAREEAGLSQKICNI